MVEVQHVKSRCMRGRATRNGGDLSPEKAQDCDVRHCCLAARIPIFPMTAQPWQARKGVAEMLRCWIMGTASAALFACSSLSVSAAPAGGMALIRPAVEQTSTVDQVAYRHCWWRDGVRYCGRRDRERTCTSMGVRGPKPLKQALPLGGARWTTRGGAATGAPAESSGPDTRPKTRALCVGRAPKS